MYYENRLSYAVECRVRYENRVGANFGKLIGETIGLILFYAKLLERQASRTPCVAHSLSVTEHEHFDRVAADHPVGAGVKCMRHFPVVIDHLGIPDDGLVDIHGRVSHPIIYL